MTIIVILLATLAIVAVGAAVARNRRHKRGRHRTRYFAVNLTPPAKPPTLDSTQR